MQTQPCSVDDAVAFLFPEDNYAVATHKHPIATFTEDVDSFIPSEPSCFFDPMAGDDDSTVCLHVWNNQRTTNSEHPSEQAEQAEEARPESPETSDRDSIASSQQGNSPAAQKEKKRLIAWTPEEHK
eukprot:396463-Rhodomonas_salina.1